MCPSSALTPLPPRARTGHQWKRAINWTNTENVCAFQGASCDDDCYVQALTLPANMLEGTLWEDMFVGLPRLYLLDLVRALLARSSRPLRPSLTLFNGTVLATLPQAINKLYGTIPERLFDPAPNLTMVILSHNYLSGTLPQLKLSTSLTHLHINDNYLEGTLPDEICALPATKAFLVGSNHFYGTVPPTFSYAPNLTTVSFSSCDFSGTLPDVSTNTKLEVYDFSYNDMTGALPNLTALVNLTHFNVQFNRIRDTIPRDLAFLPNVEQIGLQYNRLSCNFPDVAHGAFPRIPAGGLSVLSGNLFDCPIPDELNGPDPGIDTYYCGMGAELYLVPLTCLCMYLLAVGWHAWPWGRFRLEQHLTADAKAIDELGELGPGKEAVTYIRFSRMTVTFTFVSAVLGFIMLFVYRDAEAEYECRGPVMNYTAAYITGEQTSVPVLVHIVLVAVAVGWMHSVRKQRHIIWGSTARASTDATTAVLRRLGSDRTKKERAVRRCMRYTKFGGTMLLVILTFFIPASAYVATMNSDSLPVDVKRTASVAMAFFMSWMYTYAGPSAAVRLVRAYTRPQTLKHRFEYQIRTAGVLTVAISVVVPLVSVLIFDRICLFNIIDPPKDVTVHLPERICAHMDNFTTHKCDFEVYRDYETTVHLDVFYDERCPSQVLHLFGVVFMHTMLVQGMVRGAPSASRLISLVCSHAVRPRRCCSCRRRCR